MDNSKPICSKEALELLNCVAGPDFDQDKCLHFLQSLRECVLKEKVKRFSLAEQTEQAASSISKKPG